MCVETLWQDEKLSLKESGLSEAARRYAEGYLARLNRYRPIGFYEGSPVFSLYQAPPATEAGRRALAHRLARRFEGARLPATATLSITAACQCACEHCSALFYNRAKAGRSLSSQEYARAVRETADLGATTLIFLGGEPLLAPYLDTLIQAVPPAQSVAILFTNGELLSRDRAIRLRRNGLMGLFVSLDYPDGRRHDAARARPGLFEKALRGIQNAREAGLIAGISSYLSGDRLRAGLFEEMMELGKDLGVAELTFFDAIPSGRWLRDTTCLLSGADRLDIAERVRRYRKRAEYPGLSVQSTLTSECGSAFCFAGNTQFYLSAFGDMCPCDFTPLSIGRFPNENLRTLWERMISTPPYDTRAKACRMQSLEFRKRYIDTIPIEGPYPYPFGA